MRTKELLEKQDLTKEEKIAHLKKIRFVARVPKRTKEMRW